MFTRRTSVVSLLAAVAGLASIVAAQGTSPLLGHFLEPNELVLSTNNGQQQIEIVIDELGVQVVGVAGVPDTLFTGVTAIRLTTGTAFDAVTVSIRTAHAPAIFVNTGLGNSDVKFIYEIPQSPEDATSYVQVIGQGGGDIVGFEGTTLSQSFTATWDLRLGSGTNEVTANMSNPEPTLANNINIIANTGIGADKLNVNIVSGALVHNFNVQGTLGDGLDEAILAYDGIAASQTNVNFNFTLAGGNDKSEALLVSRGGELSVTGLFFGGNGADDMKFFVEGDGNVDVAMNGDAGNDYLDMSLKGIITGSPRFFGGANNDFLKIVVDGPRLVTPLLNGGTGFDAAIGFGTFVSVEQIN